MNFAISAPVQAAVCADRRKYNVIAAWQDLAQSRQAIAEPAKWREICDGPEIAHPALWEYSMFRILVSRATSLVAGAALASAFSHSMPHRLGASVTITADSCSSFTTSGSGSALIVTWKRQRQNCSLSSTPAPSCRLVADHADGAATVRPLVLAAPKRSELGELPTRGQQRVSQVAAPARR